MGSGGVKAQPDMFRKNGGSDRGTDTNPEGQIGAGEDTTAFPLEEAALIRLPSRLSSDRSAPPAYSP